MENIQPAESKVLTDDLIAILGQSDEEIMKFIGVTSEIEEYELHFTTSSEILNLSVDDMYSMEGEEEFDDDYYMYEDEDKEKLLQKMQTTESKIADDINKYLKVLKSKESIEFEQISREEIFERLRCKCFEWRRWKNKNTITSVMKQICKDKICKREAIRRQAEEDEYKRYEEEERLFRIKEKAKNKKWNQILCGGPAQKIEHFLDKSNLTALERKKKGKRAAHKDKKIMKALFEMQEKQKIEKKDVVEESEKEIDMKEEDKERSLSSSTDSDTEPSIDDIIPDKLRLRIKDSIAVKKIDLSTSINKSDSTLISSSTTITTNLQHLNSIDKIGKRKVHPSMFGTYLNEFNTIQDFAFIYVDNILMEAESKVNVSIIDPLEQDIKDYICSEYLCGDQTIKLPSIGAKTMSLYSQVYGYDLTDREGKKMIQDIIKTWILRKSWRHCIDFLGHKIDSCSDFYIYEVKWSEPTYSYPIPQVTASVYFTIELSRIKPTLFPPKVTFVFETEQYKFTSYDDILHENFLDNIIKCKTMFFKQIRY